MPNITIQKKFLTVAREDLDIHGPKSLAGWCIYSEECKGGFCLDCCLFSGRVRGIGGCQKLGVLVSNPLDRKWHRATEILSAHEKSHYHQKSMGIAKEFISQRENPELAIDVQLGYFYYIRYIHVYIVFART